MKTLITFLLFLFNLSAFSQLEFVQHQITNTFIKGADVIAVDLDQDGNMDIISVNSHTNAEIAWWKNNGFNEFTKITIRDNLNKARSVRSEDINDDQHIDLVVAIYGENSIIYLENNGDETFTDYTVDANFVGAHTIDIKDVNDDGYLDILCSGFDYYYHNGEIAWWENDGLYPIGWTKNLISNRFQQSPFVYGEDMDEDDDLDVIACGELNNEIFWWENDGDENFTEHMVDDQITGIHTVIARDVDLDGDFDILAAACLGSQIAWYENTESQDFIKHPLGYFPGALWLDAADLDNDGDRDLFGGAQGASHLAWWENPGNQQFIKHNFNSTFTQTFCVVPAMMDNDNDIDLVAIGWQSNTISWFENKLENPNLLNNPESVVYDSVYKRYLVSNWEDGNIIQIDTAGQQSYFNTELSSTAGLHIVGDTLFVSSNVGEYSGIIGFLLSSSEIVFHVNIPEKQLLNDITSDLSGNLYVTDCEANKIYKIRINDQAYTTFVGSGLGYPNGIMYDRNNHRLLVLNCLLTYRPIISVNLEDSTLLTVVNTNISSIDGLTSDNYGNIYFSSWATDKVYRYDESFTNPPEVVSTGHTDPADIFFNKLNNILAIPNFNSNSVDFIQLAFVIYVPGDEPTIQAGIDNAQNGDTVLVAPGIYNENINFNGKNIVVASHYIIDNDLDIINSTIIDGSNPTSTDTASCVMFYSGEDSTAVLQGFTITQGTGTHWIDSQFPSYTRHSGGGIFMFQSSPTIKNNYIINNHVDDNSGVNGASGGGLLMYGSNPTIINNVIKNNTALYGAGVVIDYSGCFFKNNIVAQNSGGQNYGGGGFWTIGNGDEDIIIENNTIVDNESELKGGAMYLWSTHLTARSNIIWGNTQNSGGQIYLYDGANAEISYSNIEGGYTGEGNIDLPPQFADTNFILDLSSPCIDAGNSDIQFNDPEDFENPGYPLWPSQGQLRNDIGVFGGPNSCCLQNDITGINNVFPSSKEIVLEVFPNPFSESTMISLKGTLPFSEQTIEIMDIKGQVVKRFSKITQNMEIIWDASNDFGYTIKPGLYILRLLSGYKTQTMKVLFINN
ncbi:MAG: VCBS repeat-containing protein [Bacteroidales bacterium]|nr:VCBS repeat-containing protein [Bacteroidales bacterium]